jgi:hypothetical protein
MALACIADVKSGDEIVAKERLSEITRRRGVARQGVRNWLDGARSPSSDNLARIVELSGFSGDYLLGADDCLPERNAPAVEQMQAVVAYVRDWCFPVYTSVSAKSCQLAAKR